MGINEVTSQIITDLNANTSLGVTTVRENSVWLTEERGDSILLVKYIGRLNYTFYIDKGKTLIRHNDKTERSKTFNILQRTTRFGQTMPEHEGYFNGSHSDERSVFSAMQGGTDGG